MFNVGDLVNHVDISKDKIFIVITEQEYAVQHGPAPPSASGVDWIFIEPFNFIGTQHDINGYYPDKLTLANIQCATTIKEIDYIQLAKDVCGVRD